MAKITYIGAGSTSFAQSFFMDILTRPALAEGTLALMDIDQEQLDVMTTLAKKMAKQLKVSMRIESTTDRRRALDGADHVVCTITAPGGLLARQTERRISQKYGVNQAVGCTSGPGGVFRTLRYVPMMLDICRDMEELCPDAWFLHYANPTTMVPWALNVASPIRSIGMCHSVQGTAMQLAGYIGAPYEQTGHWVAGVNHQAWVLRFEWKGEDAYPLLWERMEDSEVYRRDMVRFEIMRRFGYFSTESSTHHSEYYPYFRRTPELIARWTPEALDGLSEEIREEKEAVKARETLREKAYGDAPVQIRRSREYCVGIIHAIETNEPYRFNGNVMNTGLITNLPEGCCVEVPCLVDNMGVHPCYVGDLPPQCAALNRNRIAGDELAVKGALEGDRRAVEQAVALDPLTGATCTLDQIHDMVEELFEALAEYLPQFS